MPINTVRPSLVPPVASQTRVNKYLKMPESEKRAHVEAYVKSNMTRQAYCEQNDLKLSSFRNWTTRYSRKRVSDFVPIIAAPIVERPTTDIPHTPLSRIEICKRDCKVTVTEISNVNIAIEIIKGVLSCS